jgi:peptidoglycan/LPS O-acetylase OafA/YrhL
MQHIENRNNRPIYSIQILRGIAAFAVVLVHHQSFIQLSADNPFGKVIPGCSWGVDLFFMISGFIAAYTVPVNGTGVHSGANYLLQRFIRILPLYYIITILSFGSDATAWINSLKSMLFIPIGGDVGPRYGGSQIGQGWTLNYEMYFYVVVATSFVFGRFKWVYSLSFILSIIVLPLIIQGSIPENYSIYGFSLSPTYFSMITHPVILEFLAGALLGLYYPRIKNSITYLDIALCLCGIGSFIYNIYNQRWVGHSIQGWGWSCFLLLVSVVKLEKCGFYIKNKILLHIGSCSYSIYILHENIKNIVIKLSKHFADLITLSGTTKLLLSLGTTLIIAHYTNKLIEIKLSHWLKIKLINNGSTFNKITSPQSQ